MRRLSPFTQPGHRRLVLAGVVSTAVIVGAVIVAGRGGTGVALGTGDAVGYPTVVVPTLTPTALPSATSVPLPSSTPTTAPTATFVPSATPSPQSATSTATVPAATSTATGTATASPSKPPLSLHLSARALIPGDLLIVTVHTLAHLRVAITIAYPSLQKPRDVVVRTDAHGTAVLKVSIVGSHTLRKTPQQGTISAHIAESNYNGSASALFTLYPPVRWLYSARVTGSGAERAVMIAVQLDRAARVAALVALSPGKYTPLLLRGQSHGPGTLVLTARIPALHGRALARVTITVTSKEGITEMRTLVVPLSR